MSFLTNDPLEVKSKMIYQEYLIYKYPDLYEMNYTCDSLISNFSSFKLTNGQSNEIYFCQLINRSDMISEYDSKVVIRFFGSQLTGSGNTYKMNDTKEKEIHDKVSQILKLPKILYTFARGRIESFFELQSINLEEFERCSTEIAKIASQIHSIDISDIIQMDPDLLSNTLQNIYNEYLANISSFKSLQLNNELKKEKFEEISSFDYKKMIDWAVRVSKKINPKLTFSHNDMNRTNFHWLKNSEKNELILIDFEYANYGYRWSDLSNYLVELTVEKASGRKESVESFFPGNEFCRKFLVNYLENLKNNNAYNFEESDFNLKKLIIEVDFGCIVINLIRLVWILGLSDRKLSEFNFWEDAHLRLHLMQKLHGRFCANYSMLDF